jgi:hypothetical protein
MGWFSRNGPICAGASARPVPAKSKIVKHMKVNRLKNEKVRFIGGPLHQTTVKIGFRLEFNQSVGCFSDTRFNGCQNESYHSRLPQEDKIVNYAGGRNSVSKKGQSAHAMLFLKRQGIIKGVSRPAAPTT